MSLQRILLLCLLLTAAAFAQQSTSQTPPPTQMYVEPTMAYTPSLDVPSMDRSVDPCVDFYSYSCGGWEKNNPIPPDQSSWSVYGKLYEDNLKYLRGILQEASTAKDRDAVTQKIGDYYAACMDEPAVEKLGAKPIAAGPGSHRGAEERATNWLRSPPGCIWKARRFLFSSGSQQDPDNSDAMIVGDQPGRPRPARSRLLHQGRCEVERDSRALSAARAEDVRAARRLARRRPSSEADTVMRIETALAKASLTRVERRDPYKVTHKMKVADLKKLAPNFDWAGVLLQQQRSPVRHPERRQPRVLQGDSTRSSHRFRSPTGRAICASMSPTHALALLVVRIREREL